MVSLGCQTALDQETLQGFGHLQSVPSPEWVRETVVYEVFVRAFSPEGTFARLTGRLPELKDLGVGTIWLMPIYPVGQAGRKGTLGVPIRSGIIWPSIRNSAPGMI